jgi:hypothetical protein
MAGSSKPVKVFHSKAITQIVGRTGYPNGLAMSHGIRYHSSKFYSE